MTPFTETELRNVQYAFTQLGVDDDISLVLQVEDYGRILIGAVDELQSENLQLRLQLAEAELKLSTFVQQLAQRIAALETLGIDNRHILYDIESIAKELM